MQRTTVLVLGFWVGFCGGNSLAVCERYLVDWSRDLSQAIEVMPLKPVDKALAKHAVEQRGFLSVSLDYENPDGRKVDVFYRLIPRKGTPVQHPHVPVMVIFNGGPGLPSSAYRPLDYDYDQAPVDLLTEFEKHFRVLLIDQRGTAGLSCPLDLDSPKLRVELIHHLFNTEQHARDAAHVAKRVIGAATPWYILAQSYGGQIGLKYLEHLNEFVRPRGIVLASAGLPGGGGEEHARSRRLEQVELQKRLVAAIPGIDQKLIRLRAHLEKNGVSSTKIHALWSLLGKGIHGEWEKRFDAEVDSLLAMGKAELEKYPLFSPNYVQLLNYVLSSSAITPGFTDNTLAAWSQKEVPIEPWMLEEAVTLQIHEKEWPGPAIDAVDENPPPGAVFNTEKIRRNIETTQVLFTFGAGDAYVPMTVGIPLSEPFRVRGHMTSVNLPGGHRAAFNADGVDAIQRWIRSLP